MQAKLTRCLFGNEMPKLTIRTCAEMLLYMDEIYKFIHSLRGRPQVRLSSDFRGASIVIKGEFLEENLPEIEQFVKLGEWRK